MFIIPNHPRNASPYRQIHYNSFDKWFHLVGCAVIPVSISVAYLSDFYDYLLLKASQSVVKLFHYFPIPKYFLHSCNPQG